MSGTKRLPIVLQARDRFLFSELDVMRIMDRETADRRRAPIRACCNSSVRVSSTASLSAR